MSPDWEKDVPERYRVSYDKLTGAFKILDCWHETIRNLPLDAEVADTSPAIKILSSEEVNTLLGKLNEMGWLSKLRGNPSKPTGVVIEKAIPSKSIQEVAIENIVKIAHTGMEESVMREAIIAIRELGGKRNG